MLAEDEFWSRDGTSSSKAAVAQQWMTGLPGQECEDLDGEVPQARDAQRSVGEAEFAEGLGGGGAADL